MLFARVASKKFIKKRLYALFASLVLWHGLEVKFLKMYKLYEKNEIYFALMWIVAYVAIMAPIKGQFSWLFAIIAFSAGIIAFVRFNHLEEKYGLSGFPENMKKYLYFIPMFILATGNLWGGYSLAGGWTELFTATLSMIFVGFVEEMLFRGFLFKAMLGKGKTNSAIFVSAVTFGIGHILNMFEGQASFETLMQIIFAISWGFILTMVFYKSGSLLPCIIAHAMIDTFSLYGTESDLTSRIYIGATIVTAIVYCIYLSRLHTPDSEKKMHVEK
ncbi:MAG: CPBP family intramembrane glutamic endopeptidase [Absicoccus porci]